MPGGPDVTAIVPFADDEERVGAVARRLAGHLCALGLTFELLFVDEDARDNSVAVLALLRDRELPALRIVTAPRGEGFAAASGVARGRALWLVDIARADAPLAPLGWALRRIAAGSDVVWVAGRFVVTRRTRTWAVCAGVSGRGDAYARRLVGRARRRNLVVDVTPVPVRRRLMHLLG